MEAGQLPAPASVTPGLADDGIDLASEESGGALQRQS